MIAKRLKILREKQGLKIKEIAKLINVSPSTYREWELGTKISGEPYMALSDVLNVSLEYLITGREGYSNDKTAEVLEALDSVIFTISKIKNDVITLKKMKLRSGVE